MPGRHQLSTSRSKLRWLAGIAGTVILTAVALGALPAANAGASGTVVKTQLTLTGLASADNPLGGSQIGIHPGDSVQFDPAVAPTAGLAKLGLDGLVNSVLGLLANFQVKADFSSLPGGRAGTVIDKSSGPITFDFTKKGTYSFTWTAQSVGLVGGVVPIKLDANQLKSAGVALNASNQYIAKIVVSDNPPSGGISVQLPGVSVAPSIPGHQLPSVGVPGVNGPTLPVTVPSLPVNVPSLPNVGGNGGSSGNGASAPAGSAGSTELPVPARVVPRGDGQAVYGNAGGFGGNAAGATVLGGSGGSAPLTKGGSSSTSAAAPVLQQDSTGKHKTIDLAASKASSTGQFSVILAIVAIIALSVVAATYARLYLLKREVGA